MSLILVTCGTSLSSASRCWLECDQFGRLLLDDRTEGELLMVLPSALRHLQDRRQSVLNQIPGMGDASVIRKSATNIAREKFRQECWALEFSHLLSAELATLLRMNLIRLVHEPDRVVFLHGHLNHRDAYLNEAVLTLMVEKGNFPCVQTDVANVGEWDPTNGAAFENALRALNQTIQNQRGQYQANDELLLVLTGGYKILSIYLGYRLGRRTGWAGGPSRILYLSEGPNRELIQIAIPRDDGGATANVGDTQQAHGIDLDTDIGDRP